MALFEILSVVNKSVVYFVIITEKNRKNQDRISSKMVAGGQGLEKMSRNIFGFE